MLQIAKGLWSDEDGLTTVEYALLLALLVVAAIGVWTGFGAKVRTAVSTSGAEIESAQTPTP